MRYLFSFVMTLLLIVPAFSQTEPNFFQIRDSMRLFFQQEEEALAAKKADKDKTASAGEAENEKDSKFAKYRRWEWFWETRVHEDGSFPTPKERNELFQAYQDKLATKESSTAEKMMPPPAWANISRTNNTGGYWGMGRTTTAAFHPVDSNLFYVTAISGGVWKTTNGGTSYTPVGDNLPFLSTGAILMDMNNANTLYVATGHNATGTGYTYDNFSAGIFKSTNGGSTWTPVLGNTLSQQVTYFKLAQQANAPIYVYACSSLGLYLTENGGTTWTIIDPRYCTDLDVSGAVYYAILDGDIYRNANASGLIKVKELGVPANTHVKLAVSKLDNSKVVAYFGNQIWRSSDSGVTWTAGTIPQNYEPAPNGSPDNPACMMFSPVNSNVLFSGNLNMYRSTDFGLTWTQISHWWNSGAGFPEVHADHRGLAYNPVSKKIYSLNDGGVDRYTEPASAGAGTWTQLSNGLIIQQYYSAASSVQNPNIIVAGAQDNGGTRRQNNLTWFNTTGGDAGTQAINPANDQICFSNYNPSPHINRSLDGGISYTDLLPLPTAVDTPFASYWVIPYQINPKNPNGLYAAWHAVFRSSNNGTTWTKISPNLTPVNAWNLSLRSIAVAPSDSNYIYVATDTQLWRTTNGGTSWALIFTSNDVPITSIEIEPSNSGIVFLSFGKYNSSKKVWASFDGGTTWGNYFSGLPNVPINDLLCQKNAGIIYAATDYGVYSKSLITSTNWQAYGGGMPAVPVVNLHIQYGSGKLRAASMGRGMYETGIECIAVGTLSVSNITIKSARITWPDAFMPSYTITLQAAGGSVVTVTTNATGTSYDLTGLAYGTTYTVIVSSNCPNGGTMSSPSLNFTTLPCDVPTTFAATNIAPTSALITWTGTGADAYSIFSNNCVCYVAQNIVGSSYLLTGLIPGTSYQMFVDAVCNGTTVVNGSAVNFVTPACSVPTALATSNINTTGATISWTPIPGVTNYRIQYKLSTSGSYQNTVPITTSGNSYTFNGLMSGKTYNWRVRTWCGGTYFSPQTNGPAFTTLIPCSPPTVFSATNIGATSAKINWTASGAASYAIYDNNCSCYIAQNIVGTSYVMTGLSPSTTYTIYIDAICSGQIVLNANSLTFTTLLPCGSPPTGAKVSTISPTTATVTWDSMPGITNYRVQYKLSTAAAYSNTSPISTTTNSFTLTGLTEGSTYNWRVRSHCGGTTFSSYANGAAFVPSLPLCQAAPMGRLVSNITNNSATVNWVAVPGVMNYRVQYKLSTATTYTNTAPLSTTATSFILTGLTAGSTYDWRVRSFCGTGYGPYGTGPAFTLTNLLANAMDDREATLNYDSEPWVDELLDIYPNPTDQNVSILYINEAAAQKGRLRITDILGRVVLEKEIDLVSGENLLELNTAQYAIGQYYVSIYTGIDRQFKSGKMVIER